MKLCYIDKSIYRTLNFIVRVHFTRTSMVMSHKSNTYSVLHCECVFTISVCAGLVLSVQGTQTSDVMSLQKCE